MKAVKHVLAIGIVATAMAVSTVKHASAATRTWTATTAGANLTVGGSGGNWNNAAVPGVNDTGVFNQGGSGAGSGATTSITVSGTSFNPAILSSKNIGSNITISDGSSAGTITIGKLNSGGNAFVTTSQNGGLTFNNTELDFNTGNSGIFTSSDPGGFVTVNTTSFKMGLGSSTGSKNFLVSYGGNVTVNPTVDFSPISADQPLTLVAHGSSNVSLGNGITGSGSFITNVGINNDASDDPLDQTGTVLINGTSSFTGATAVGNGTAIFAGTYNGSGTTTVSAGATVAGAGTIAGGVDLLGIMSAGNTPGSTATLSVGSLTLETGSSGIFDLQNTGGNHAGSGSDLVAVSGALTLLGGGFTFNVSPIGGGSLNNAGTWELMSYGSTSGSLGPITLTGVDTADYNAVVTVGPGFNGNGVYLTLTPVPEPGMSVLASLGAVGLAAVRVVYRRKQPSL